MAKQTGLTDKFYIGGRDLSGDVSAVDTIATRKATLDVPVLESAGMVRLAGHGDGEISFSSWFDDGTKSPRPHALRGAPSPHSLGRERPA